MSVGQKLEPTNGSARPPGRRPRGTAAGTSAARDERERAVAARRQPPRRGAQREERARDGAGQRRQTARTQPSTSWRCETARSAPRPTVDAEAEGEPARDQVQRGRRRRTRCARAPLGVVEALVGDALEQIRRGHGAERADDPRPEQPSQRREQDAVARHVVARVPGVVPQREALAAEELGAVDLRGEVGARGVDDEVQPRQIAATTHAGVRSIRASIARDPSRAAPLPGQSPQWRGSEPWHAPTTRLTKGTVRAGIVARRARATGAPSLAYMRHL